MVNKKDSKQMVLGLDIGSNSIGWALLEADGNTPNKIVGLGSRIFTKAVEEKTPTPKNVKRRNARLTRRVLQRRSRRKQRMLHYLISLGLLPAELKGHDAPEVILNYLGDPYQLRSQALDHPLTEYQLGRVFLHFVQRRGFLSNRKTILGDLVDDPDVMAVLAEEEDTEDRSSERAKEETQFKREISQLREAIDENGYRTLGEYLATIKAPHCKRNRIRDGGHLRTDRQMYRDELELIWEQQSNHHNLLTDEIKEEIEEIVFFQRPLKLRSDRIGKCSLEHNKKRARIARLESQRFRYLQDINSLEYFDNHTDQWHKLSDEDREKLVDLFESRENVTFAGLRKALGFDKKTEFNLERNSNKKLKGNITSCEIRKHYPEWDELTDRQQYDLVEDMLTIGKKSVLRKRLITHWGVPSETAIQLCMLEFEPGHSNHSLKAINKLLLYLKDGLIYSDARQEAGYGYEKEETEFIDKLGAPPEIPNPIVQKGLHELRRLVNAVIAEYGKPDVIRIEMARDLEMNTKRYKAQQKQQNLNTKANDQATDEYQKIASANSHMHLSKYPSHTDKLKYRLWLDQDKRCAYSNKTINLTTLFSADIEVDHILPYSQSLDDSYMNKVVCFAPENQYKGQRTPIDAFGNDEEKWTQIAQAISHWGKKLQSKRSRFFMRNSDVQKRDFISSQLNDTRYISKVALSYLAPLVGETNITTSRGQTTAWMRHQWGLNSLLGETSQKERTDHRHHAIDAAVVACIDRSFYQGIVKLAKTLERENSSLTMKDLHIDPPWDDLRDDLSTALDDVIISHAPLRKLTGALHEETGVGYIEGIGCVARKNLDGEMTAKRAEKIVDPTVCEIVLNHLQKFGNKPKEAFAEDVTLYHKDGVTPIKRVRMVQSRTTMKKLEQTKFGVRNQKGEVFKWLAYGNTHHVEIIQNRKSGKVSGRFVTMMEATHRARGIGMPKQAIIQKDHGDDGVLLMALHINDLVSVLSDYERVYYRVQKLDSGINRIMLRLHTTANIDNKEEELHLTINQNIFDQWELQRENTNVIGKIIE